MDTEIIHSAVTLAHLVSGSYISSKEYSIEV